MFMSYNSHPLPRKTKNFGGLAKEEALLACCCHELFGLLLYCNQFVPCCTTKYVFKLGKNKFDRTNAILVGALRRGVAAVLGIRNGKTEIIKITMLKPFTNLENIVYANNSYTLFRNNLPY
jgi:hypothetical protein